MPFTITIDEIRPVVDEFGVATHQHVEFAISDGTDAYAWRFGGVPVGVDAQEFLEARAERIWTRAQKRGEAVPATTTFKQELRRFIDDNPQVRQLITSDYRDLLDAIANQNATQRIVFQQFVALWMRWQYEEMVK